MDGQLLRSVLGRTFREDLFYRLAVIRIDLPPLREQPEDIGWLAERMLQQIALEQGRPLAMSEAFLCDVLGRSWRGNARELRSYLEQAVVLSEEGVLDVPEGASPRTISRQQGFVDKGEIVSLQSRKPSGAISDAHLI